MKNNFKSQHELSYTDWFLKTFKITWTFNFCLCCFFLSFPQHFPLCLCRSEQLPLQNSNLILFTLCFKENWTSPGFTFSRQILARQRYHSYSGDKRIGEMGNGKDWQEKKSQCVFIWKKVNPFHSLIFFAFEIALLFHLGFRVFKLREARNRDIFFVPVK